MNYQVVVYPVNLIRPSEEIDTQTVKLLTKRILDCQTWTSPVSIENNTGMIMDGNHRYQVAKQLNLKYIPCIILDYDDSRVKVYHWAHNEPFCPLKIKDHVLIQGKLLPYKTTRHIFSPHLPDVSYALSSLNTDFNLCSITS